MPISLRMLRAVLAEIVVLARADGLYAVDDGTGPVDPGLVHAEQWRPNPDADLTAQSCAWGAADRKR